MCVSAPRADHQGGLFCEGYFHFLLALNPLLLPCWHFRKSTSSKNLPHRKSRSKDYDVYSDDDVCNQEPEDNFAKELQQYMQAKEMANAAQSLPFPEESMKKEGVKNTQKAVKRKKKNLKAVHKNGKQKKMKRKWPGTGDKGSNTSLKHSGSQEQDGKPKEEQHVRMSQGFINQHTVERNGKQICKYFLERKCIKGDQCKFDHDAEIEKKKEMCKFYVQGYCTRGENCLYLHNILYYKRWFWILKKSHHENKKGFL
ncbi:hypothetical protein MC885_000983 [Smutsia gigantea]|nr:hypothetical protein MC885_000983 [Smutsia gigantea]